MAGLSFDRGAAAAPGGRDRAQLLLVGAFGLAVLLLVLAGVVNSVTYTESLATRGDGLADGRDVAALQADVRAGVGGAVERINADTATNYTQKDARVGRSVGNWSGAVARLYARDVAAVDVTLNRTVHGSRIAGDTDSTLTNDVGASDWTLVADVSRTRDVRLNLSRATLTTGSCATNPCFELAVVGATEAWTVAVNRSYVTVREGPDKTGQCAISSDRVLVDVTAGTVGGRECPPLAFAAGVAAPYDIEFRNGNSAEGTYRLIVDPDVAEIDGADYDGADPPTLSAAVYATHVRVTYRTPQVEYDTVIRVAGGEPGG